MRDLTGRQILFVAACTLALASLGVGVFGLLHGPDSRPRPAGPLIAPAAPGGLVTTPATEPVPAEPRALPHTSDPIAYAEAVAAALFTWDTSTGMMPADVSAPIVADADPTGEATAGLLVDLATYLPSDEQWMDLAVLKVAQTIEITNSAPPRSWPRIVADSHGKLTAGNAAVTIDATRARRGVWNEEPATSSYEVSFTIFLTCPPAVDRCRVLRLSQLDKPLR